jgi:hypothetical protein
MLNEIKKIITKISFRKAGEERQNQEAVTPDQL